MKLGLSDMGSSPHWASAWLKQNRNAHETKIFIYFSSIMNISSVSFFIKYFSRANFSSWRKVAAGERGGVRLTSRHSFHFVQSMAAEAGFDLKIRVTEFATSLKQGEDGDYQIFLIGWSGRSDPDGNSYSFQTCGSPQNNAKYCDKDVDAAHAEARAKSDPAERKKAYEKVAAKFLPEGSILYIYHRRVLVALTDKVEGYKQIPDGLVRVVGVKLK